jgi:hypothetical protein
LRPWRNARKRPAVTASSDLESRNPITGIADCCACAMSGQTDALLMSAMKLRRFTADPFRAAAERIARQRTAALRDFDPANDRIALCAARLLYPQYSPWKRTCRIGSSMPIATILRCETGVVSHAASRGTGVATSTLGILTVSATPGRLLRRFSARPSPAPSCAIGP